MPKIDLDKVPYKKVGGYPGQYAQVLDKREKKQLGDVVGLSQFGVNITRLKPGGASSLRHWHREEDEFVYVLEGEVVLTEGSGETILRAGDCAGWKANSGDGHCIENRSDRDAILMEVGTRAASEHVIYPDADLVLKRDVNGRKYFRKNGEPYT
jgi:uncharacterized cupin superfamily protein